MVRQNEEISQQRDALGRAYENMQVLSVIGQEIVHHLCVKDITKSAYQSINKLMPADCFAIGVYNEKLKRVEYRHVMENGVEAVE